HPASEIPSALDQGQGRAGARARTVTVTALTLVCRICPFLALSGHADVAERCPLSGGLCCKTGLLFAARLACEFWSLGCAALPLRSCGIDASAGLPLAALGSIRSSIF